MDPISLDQYRIVTESQTVNWKKIVELKAITKTSWESCEENEIGSRLALIGIINSKTIPNKSYSNMLIYW